MRRATAVLIGIALCGFGVRSSAQQQADTEIYLAQVDVNAQPMIKGPLTNISNNPGYDSQPSFLPDGSAVLFSSVRGGTEYDIYKYDLASQKVVQVTDSPDNENSPLVMPGGGMFSAVRSEVPIGAENQRLWRFNLDGSNATVVLPSLRRVGYHVWVDPTHVVVYVLAAAQGEPNTLQYVDVTTGQVDVIDKEVGRSLQLRPGTWTVTYISQPRGEKALVKEFDPKTKRTMPLIEAVEGSMFRDTAWHAGQILFMSAGTKVFACASVKLPPNTQATGPAPASAWVQVADLESAGIRNITRMAISPSARGGTVNIALVAEPVRK